MITFVWFRMIVDFLLISLDHYCPNLKILLSLDCSLAPWWEKVKLPARRIIIVIIMFFAALIKLSPI